MKKSILLLGGGLQALSVSRSLKEIGCFTTGFVDRKNSASKCRYIDCKVFPPVLVKNAENYKLFLIEYLLNYPQDVIIPMSDIHADFLSCNKEEIEKMGSVRCAIPEYSIFKKANDKWELLKLCAQMNLPHPRTDKLIEKSLEHSAKYVGFPALIKPNLSVGAKGITLVNNLEELEYHFPIIHDSYGECTLQEYICNAGPYYNVMMYRDAKGKIINYTIVEIIRYYPIKGGSSSFCRTIECQELVDICTETLKALNWIGFADFDVLKDAKGGYKIIEINPRVPASIKAAAVSGVNFPSIIIDDIMGKTINPYEYKTGSELRYLGLDFMWFIASNRRFSCSPSWFKFLGKNLHYQEGGFADIGAMIFSLCEGMRKASNHFLRKKN